MGRESLARDAARHFLGARRDAELVKVTAKYSKIACAHPTSATTVAKTVVPLRCFRSEHGLEVIIGRCETCGKVYWVSE